MNKEIKKMWVDALRSGKYKQGQGWLRTANNKYCCLGVLCDLAVNEERVRRDLVKDVYAYGKQDRMSVLPSEVIDWAELDQHGTYGENRCLVYDNDGGKSFAEIADIIEENF